MNTQEKVPYELAVIMSILALITPQTTNGKIVLQFLVVLHESPGICNTSNFRHNIQTKNEFMNLDKVKEKMDENKYKGEDTIAEELHPDENSDPIVDIKMSISTLLRESS